MPNSPTREPLSRAQIALVLLTLSLSFSPLWGVSQLNFPSISFTDITGIAIVNPTTFEATVTLTAYGENGLPINSPGFTNPAQVIVPAGQQFSKVVQEIFQGSLDPEVVAWVQATSPVSDLTGFFLTLDAAPTFFDGADLPRSAARIVFTNLCLEEDCSTEVNLINPGNQARTVDLEIIGLAQPVSSQIQLPALGVARIDARSLLPQGVAATGAVSPGSAYIIASSDGVIAGFQFVRQQAGDLLGLNAKPADEFLNTIFFPQLAVLDLFRSEITVINLGESAALVTFRAFQPDGEPYGPGHIDNNPVSRNLLPGQRLTEDVEGLFGFRGDTTLSGWLLVESTSQSLNGSLSYAIPSLQSLAAVASQPQALTSAVFSHIATTGDFFTGIAILNPGTIPANVRIVALRKDGSILGSFTTVVEPRQRIAPLIHQLIPEAADQAGGFILIRSNLPVLLTSLFGSLSSGILANVPPQRIPPEFRPDAVIPQLRLNPSLAVIQPGRSQDFQIQGVMGPVTWSVNGIVGGEAGVGTITPTGSYDAPAEVPSTLPITIAGDVEGQRAAASVDVLTIQQLVGGLGTVQSIAYLEGLRQLYSAELFVSAAKLGNGIGLGSGISSRIFDVTGSSPALVLSLPDEDVRQMVSFKGIDAREYLLMAGNVTGQVVRLDPGDGSTTVVATDLGNPTALVQDPASGDLLVASGNQVLSVSYANLNSGLASPGKRALPRPLEPSRGVAFVGLDLTGITLNPCTGDIVVSDAELQRVIEINRVTGEPRDLIDLRAGHLLYLRRTGVTCPQGAQLLGVDSNGNRIFLYNFDGELIDWAEIENPGSLEELPAGNPFETDDSILISTRKEVGSEIFFVETPGIYSPAAVTINPPPILPVEPGRITFSYTATVAVAAEGIGVTTGDEVSGRFFYDPEQAEIEVSTPQVTNYILTGGFGIEINILGQTFSTRLDSEPTGQISVVNDVTGTDQFVMNHAPGAGLIIIDSSGQIFDSLAIPTFLGNFPGPTLNGILIFNTLNGVEAPISAQFTTLTRVN